MITILILILLIVNLILLIRLNKCGSIVNVHQEYSYVPMPRKRKSVKRHFEPEYEDDEN